MFGPMRAAQERHGQLGAVEHRLADVGAGGDEFGRRQIGDDALQADRERLGALHAGEAAVPVRQPLRRHGRDGGEDRAHQGGREQGFDQREARDGAARRHWAGLRRSRTVLTCRTLPAGDCTRTITVCGIQFVGCCESTKSAENGITSTRQRWPAVSPEKLPGSKLVAVRQAR